jgi:hypothetical protein
VAEFLICLLHADCQSGECTGTVLNALKSSNFLSALFREPDPGGILNLARVLHLLGQEEKGARPFLRTTQKIRT